MTLTRQPAEYEQHFLSSTDWEGYLGILRALRGVHVKVTYDRGAVELLTTSPTHEEIKTYLAQLVEAALFHYGVRYKPGGATTFRRKMLDRGLEPDECYYTTVLPQFVEGQDIETIPAPDLAIEIEVSRSALDRMGIYEALAVREVWRYSASHQLRIERLGSGGYSPAERSLILTELAVEELPRFIRIGVDRGSYDMLVAFRDWLESTE